ncbi:MAG: hypothetical protein Q9227_002904 [Pyrenula ochraceoflavens]
MNPPSGSRLLTRLASTQVRAQSTVTKRSGDISSVFPSLSAQNQPPPPLPPRFTNLKESISASSNQNSSVWEASWRRLLDALKSEIADIKRTGSNIIPSISYADIRSNFIQPSILSEIKSRGVVVIRNALSRDEALDLKSQARSYIAQNRQHVKAFPASSPAVYELYWSPAQVRARAHPDVLQTQRFLQSLWHASPSSSSISTRYPLAYADRLRIRLPGDAKFALGPHIDGGSLERWEDGSYRAVYRAILHQDGADWEAYDPFNAHHRIHANMDLYNGAGACSMLRFWQGWLSLSDTAPGEGGLKVCPMLKHATAYLMLRPFFNAMTGKLSLNGPEFPGAAMGACQELSAATHPHLELPETMVSVPKVEPGDFVAWHCDTVHAVDAVHRGEGDSSVLYIPACPLTERNAEYLKRQRDAAVEHAPPPDFPGAGGAGEGEFEGRIEWGEVEGRGEREGVRAMGMGERGWEVEEGMEEGERKVVEEANRVLFG